MPEPVDAVFHLASPASPVDYLRLPLHTLKVGSYGTHNALGLAKFKRARFLLASTSEVYGDPEVHPQREEYWGNVNPVGPRGVYDEAKRYSEAMTMAYHRQQGVDTHIVRIFNTYGPRMRQHDGRAIPNFLRQALAGQADDGVRRRVADAVVLLRRRPDRGHLPADDERRPQPVNIGNPNEMTLLELADAIKRMTGTTPRSCSRACPRTTPRCASPTSRRAREMLGWEPTGRRSRRACAGRSERRTGAAREADRPARRRRAVRRPALLAQILAMTGKDAAAGLLRAHRSRRSGRVRSSSSTRALPSDRAAPPSWRCSGWTAATRARCCWRRT